MPESKNKIGIIVLFSVVSFVGTDWSQIDVVVQSIVALITMLIDILYLGTKPLIKKCRL